MLKIYCNVLKRCVHLYKRKGKLSEVTVTYICFDWNREKMETVGNYFMLVYCEKR